VTNAQVAADVAARLVSLTNCKDKFEILETYDMFFEHVIKDLEGFTDTVQKIVSTNVNSPRNIPVVKSQEELKMKLNDYTITGGGAVTASMIQSSRPVKKDRPKKHPPKSKGPNLEF
jgi:hypothetical protein